VTPSPQRWTIVGLRSFAAVVVVVALFYIFAISWPNESVAMLISVLVILYAGIRWGRIPAIVSSIAAALALDYFLRPPYHSLRLTSVEDYVECAVLLVVGLVGSQLSITAQRRAAEAVASRLETERLYDFGRALLRPDSSQALAGTVVDEMVRTFEATGSAFRFDAEGGTRLAGPHAHLIRIDELAATIPTADSTDGLAVVPVMLAETRLGIIATLRAAMSPVAMRSVAAITGVALERVRSQEMILRLARDIQMGFLPKHLPPFANDSKVDLFAYIKPTYDVGGDFYTMSALDGTRLFFAVGDVADKGIPASLFMARTLTALDISIATSPSLVETMAAVNRTLCTNNESQMFVTVLSAILDTETGVVEYCDGGHEPPFVIATDGSAKMIEKQQGMALGVFSDYPYVSGRIALQPGESIVFYTDGVNEAMNVERELFGTQRMAQELGAAEHLDRSEAIGNALVDAVHRHVGTAPQSDDLTLLIVRWVPTATQSGGAVVTRVPAA